MLHYPGAATSAEDLYSDPARRSGLSKTRIKQAMNKGAVWIKRRRVRRATTRPKPGDRIKRYDDAAILERRPPDAETIS